MKGRPGLLSQGLTDLLPSIESPESHAAIYHLARVALMFEMWLERELKVQKSSG